MKKTKWIALLLAAALTFSLVGCTAPTSTQTSAPDGTPGTTDSATTPNTTESVTTPVLVERPEPSAVREAYPIDPDQTVFGYGVGVNPGRVVYVHDPDAFTWNGYSNWYVQGNYDADAVYAMVEDSICALAGKSNITDALDAIFLEFNQRTYDTSVGYLPGEKIAIKTNMNVTGNGSDSIEKVNGYYPSPLTLRALLQILVDYGVEPTDITVFDASRVIPTYLQMFCSEGDLAGVSFSYYHKNGKNDAQPDMEAPVLWSHDIRGDRLLPNGEVETYGGYPIYNTTYWPTCVTEAAYLINLSCLRGHSLAGFTASGKNHFGTVMPVYEDENGNFSIPNQYRTNPPCYSDIHKYVAAQDFNTIPTPASLWLIPQTPRGSYSVLVDLLSNRDCGGKTVLYICDGLAATLQQGSNMTMSEQWYSFDDGDGKGWPCMILTSQDPIALDSVALDFILAEQDAAEANGDDRWSTVLPEGHSADNYLIEGAMAHNPPSGTYYQDGYGNLITSLGVHEHWNNAEDREYSGNRKPGTGIELVQIEN